jgi:hypothetical protein
MRPYLLWQIDMSFDSSEDFSMTRPLFFFLFFLGFLAFLIDVSVGVSVGISGADSRSISNIEQGLFKICIIGGDDCFGSG